MDEPRPSHFQLIVVAIVCAYFDDRREAFIDVVQVKRMNGLAKIRV